MNPVKFAEVNTNHGAPEGTSPGRVETIPSFQGVIQGGPFDGQIVVVVARKPTLEEINALIEGGSVYLATFGGLPVHYVATSFKEAVGA